MALVACVRGCRELGTALPPLTQHLPVGEEEDGEHGMRTTSSGVSGRLPAREAGVMSRGCGVFSCRRTGHPGFLFRCRAASRRLFFSFLEKKEREGDWGAAPALARLASAPSSSCARRGSQFRRRRRPSPEARRRCPRRRHPRPPSPRACRARACAVCRASGPAVRTRPSAHRSWAAAWQPNPPTAPPALLPPVRARTHVRLRARACRGRGGQKAAPQFRRRRFGLAVLVLFSGRGSPRHATVSAAVAPRRLSPWRPSTAVRPAVATQKKGFLLLARKRAGARASVRPCTRTCERVLRVCASHLRWQQCG